MSKCVWNSCEFLQVMRSDINCLVSAVQCEATGLWPLKKNGKTCVECWDYMRFPSALRGVKQRQFESVHVMMAIIISNRTNAKLHRYADGNSTFVGFPCVLCLHPSRTGKLQCDSVKVDTFQGKTHISRGKDKNPKECTEPKPQACFQDTNLQKHCKCKCIRLYPPVVKRNSKSLLDFSNLKLVVVKFWFQ